MLGGDQWRVTRIQREEYWPGQPVIDDTQHSQHTLDHNKEQGDWRTVQSLEDRASAVTQKRVKLRESDTGDMYNIFLILSQR